MDNNFKKIKELILKSGISFPDQLDLIQLFSKAKDEDLQAVIDLFASDPSWVGKINDNHKAKHSAIMTGNLKLWRNIVQEEETQLESIED